MEQLAKQVREAETQLTTLKMSLHKIPLMVQIMLTKDLKDLQQRAVRAQEHQHKRNTQLDEFQDISGQLVVIVVAAMQAIQEGRKMVDGMAREEHPFKSNMLNCRDTVEFVQLQVQEILQQFEDFKTMTTEYTLST